MKINLKNNVKLVIQSVKNFLTITMREKNLNTFY